MVSAREALTRRPEGNLRFVSNVRGSDGFVSHTRRTALTAGRNPSRQLPIGLRRADRRRKTMHAWRGPRPS